MTFRGEKSDAALLQEVAGGDEHALELLFARYHGGLYNFLYRMVGSRDDADELLPEVFLKAWRHAKSYAGRANVSTWLYRIASNAAIDRMRKKRNLAETSLDDLVAQEVDLSDWEAGSVSDPEAPVMRQAENQTLQAALLRLSPEDRQLITLYHLQEVDYPEIQRITGLTNSALKSRLFRARQRLRAEMEKAETHNEDPVSEDRAAAPGFRARAAVAR